MTKQYVNELAEYNCWANTQICTWLQAISETQWNKTVVSSFNNIAETCLHMASAEHAWTLRIESKPQEWLAANFKSNKEVFINLWSNISTQLKKVVTQFDESKLNDILYFTRLNGDKNSLAFYKVFAHVFNHSTYHRGQIITMLRQVGFTNVYSLDLTSFYLN
jgi:uncharacterized damage-inducible protein DinB